MHAKYSTDRQKKVLGDSKGGRWAGRESPGNAGGKRGFRGGRGHGMMLAGVNLTDDQKAKMKSISQSFRERTKSLHEQIRAKRQELRQSSQGGTFSEALATQKLQETAGLQAKLMAEQFNMRQQMLAILTPEQKTHLTERAGFKAKRARTPAQMTTERSAEHESDVPVLARQAPLEVASSKQR